VLREADVIVRVPIACIHPSIEQRQQPVDHWDDLVSVLRGQCPPRTEISLHVDHHEHVVGAGLDDGPVAVAGQNSAPKSVGNGMTFKRNLVGMEDIRAGVVALSDSVASRLRRCGMKCSTVQVTIRDPQFKTICRQKKLSSPTHQTKEISEAALALIAASWRTNAPIRMLTITGQNLTTGQEEQITMFGGDRDAAHQKRERIEQAVDRIRGKYGRDAISLAVSFRDDIGIGPTPDHDHSDD
jgi:DNA polymerase-4